MGTFLVACSENPDHHGAVVVSTKGQTRGTDRRNNKKISWKLNFLIIYYDLQYLMTLRDLISVLAFQHEVDQSFFPVELLHLCE